MSLWDRVKPAVKDPTPTAVTLSDDHRLLTLTWSDAVTTTATAQTLRQRCPCASCVDEWSGARTLDVTKVGPETSIQDLHSVGNYAVAFTFSDSHNTGIYHWAFLRELTATP